jgi:predicted DNA-binding transcriptional regulator AlpA
MGDHFTAAPLLQSEDMGMRRSEPTATQPRPPLAAKTEILLRTDQAAEVLGFSPRALEAWRCRGGGPRYVRVGRSIRYRPSDLEAWTQARLCSSTSEY